VPAVRLLSQRPGTVAAATPLSRRPATEGMLLALKRRLRARERWRHASSGSTALSAPVADVDRVQLAALDTLQHGLARDAERLGRLLDGEPAGGACSTKRARN
jgi:hypothetical protein